MWHAGCFSYSYKTDFVASVRILFSPFTNISVVFSFLCFALRLTSCSFQPSFCFSGLNEAARLSRKPLCSLNLCDVCLSLQSCEAGLPGHNMYRHGLQTILCLHCVTNLDNYIKHTSHPSSKLWTVWRLRSFCHPSEQFELSPSFHILNQTPDKHFDTDTKSLSTILFISKQLYHVWMIRVVGLL